MTDKAKEVLSLYVQETVKDNLPNFEKLLFHGTTEDMDRDKIYATMLLNSITLSVDMTVQIICDLLDSHGVLPITSDERLLQKIALKIHTDTLKN